MLKINNKIKSYKRFSISPLRIGAGVVSLCLLALLATPLVHADKFDAKIDALQSKNDDAQDSLSSLISKASSYQDAIDKLRSQINSVSETIVRNEDHQAELQRLIVKTQKQIDAEKVVLGDVLRSMYVDGQMSTIEMLASSNDLSDYVDKEEYRNSVQGKIQETLKEIAALQRKLQTQKIRVDGLLADEREQKQELNADKGKLASLLNYNQSQQTNFKGEINKNRKEIARLEAQQAILNSQGTSAVHVAASGGSGGKCDNGYGNGGYPMPWCNAAKDAVVTSYHPTPGNYTNRECTSFAYWYFTSVEGNTNFNIGYGNAKYWLSNVQGEYRNRIGYTPRVGAIAVRTAGYAGHVMIVRAVAGDTFGGQTLNSHQVGVYEMNYDSQGHFRAAIKDLNSYSIDGYIYSK